jgi:hypothetical protein
MSQFGHVSPLRIPMGIRPRLIAALVLNEPRARFRPEAASRWINEASVTSIVEV